MASYQGRGQGRKGKRYSEGSRQAPTRKTKAAVDRRQNNKNVTAVSARHCAATSVLRNCCFNCCAEQSHKDNVRSSAFEEQQMQNKSSFQAQLHLPTLDLFWANLGVQHHLPPLDLLWANLRVQHHLPPLDLFWANLRRSEERPEGKDLRSRLTPYQ